MGGGFLLRAGASMSLKSGISVAWILAFASMTAGRRQRQWVPFTGGGVNVPKKRYQYCWILAFARMTVGGGVKGSGFLLRAGASMSLKSGISAAGSPHAQGERGRGARMPKGDD